MIVAGWSEVGLVLALMLAVGALAVVAVTSRRAGVRAADIEHRLRRVEEDLIRAPTRADVAHIDSRLADVATKLAVQAEKMDATASAVARIETFMLDNNNA